MARAVGEGLAEGLTLIGPELGEHPLGAAAPRG
jgi:hypothetical protein